jgi:hypothetical protein
VSTLNCFKRAGAELVEVLHFTLFLAILELSAMRKFIGIFFVVILSFIFTAQTFAAQTTPAPKSPIPLNTEEDVPQDMATYSQVVIIQLLGSLSCQLSGINPVDPHGRCLGPKGNDGKIGFVESGGALGFVGRGIAATYDFPASGGQYLAYIGNNFGLTKTANAAFGTGEGFRGLSPFIPIWTSFRNVAYLFFVLIFVIIGLGIMFRIKIDPRSVMTIQNAIPKIIIALVFITLSYAIVGFLVDMMRVVTYFVYGVMVSIPGSDLTGLTPSDIQGANPFTAANKLANSKAGIADIAWNVRGVIVSSIKDAIGLNGGGVSADGLPAIKGVGEIFGGIARNIPGIDLLASLLGKIPFIGGFFDLLGNVGKAVVSATNPQFTFANYLVHTVSVGAGLFAGISAAQIPSTGGGAEVNASFLGIGGGGGFTFNPGVLTNIPLGLIVGGAVTAFTEILLRELIPNLVAFFIVLIAIFTAMFRLWFQLIKAYIYLFLYLVFAPFFIALGIIPGMGSGLGSWFRNVLANLSVFPTTYVMLMLGKVLIDSVGKSNGDVFVPPLIGDFSNSMAGFSAILGMGILLMTPEVVNMVRGALKAPDLKLGSSIGRALGSGTGLISSPIKGGWGKLWGQDSHGHDNILTRKAGERWGRIAAGLSGGSFNKVPGTEDTGRRWFGRSKAHEEEQKRKREEKLAARTRVPGAAAPGGATTTGSDDETPHLEDDTAANAASHADGPEIGHTPDANPETPPPPSGPIAAKPTDPAAEADKDSGDGSGGKTV